MRRVALVLVVMFAMLALARPRTCSTRGSGQEAQARRHLNDAVETVTWAPD